MNKFGIIKSKLLTKLTESYANENKAEIKDILTTIKSPKTGDSTFESKILINEIFTLNTN